MQKILIIEDETNVRENLKEILEDAGYIVISATNGKEGLNVLSVDVPDLILCDIMMPEMDGYQLLESIKDNKEFNEIPFLFLSALSTDGEIRKGMNMSADDYITKPFRKKDLVSSVKARLEKRKKLDDYVDDKIFTIKQELESEHSQKIFLASMLSISPDGIFIYDLEYKRIIFNNKEFLKIIQIGEQVYSSIDTKTERDFLSAVLTGLENCINSNTESEFDFKEDELEFGDNKSIFWLSIRYAVFKQQNNKPIQYLVILRNITDKKKKEYTIKDFYDKISEELELARETQVALIPKNFPARNGHSFYPYYEPFEKIGGDFMTYKEISFGVIDLFIGDVSGHGISAAMVSAMSVLNFNLLEHSQLSILEALYSMNDSLASVSKTHYLVATYLRLDTNTGMMEYSYAGQSPGFIIRNDTIQELPGKGQPLLLIPNPIFNYYSYKVQKGDRLIFYSDGFYEIMDETENMLGLERFKQILLDESSCKGKDYVREVTNAVLRYSNSQRGDDMMLLNIEV